MINILYVSEYVPYDKIPHAGGKTLNYYINRLLKEGDCKVTLVGCYSGNEYKKFDKEKQGLSGYYIQARGRLSVDIERIVFDTIGKFKKNKGFDKSYYRQYWTIQELKKLKNSGYIPNIIFLEWTEMVTLVSQIKKIFPTAKYIASEYDVTFLRYQRLYDHCDEKKKKQALKKYNKVKKMELESISQVDIALPESYKDGKLLMENGISEDKIHILTPYYHDMRHICREEVSNDVLFWGAMDRVENYEAAIWFIDNVMPKLESLKIRFIVAGNHPPKELKERESNKVIVTGFVESEIPLFEKALCNVAPLIKGAGIKVKVIEALSAGIPVLASDVAIEGIPAKDKEDYLRCNSANEFADSIKKIVNNEIDLLKLKENQSELINKYFNLNESYSRYIDMIRSLYKDKY